MKKTANTIIIISILSLFFNPVFAQTAEDRWVDSVYNSLTETQRIGQLFNVRANQSEKPFDQRINNYIEQYNIGGITFFKADPIEQVKQTNRWQQKAQTPLMVCIDAEWGLGMRVNSALSYPMQMTLGAISNDNLITLMGEQIAEQCKRMGIHFNFAPVLDVNNNADNPVIGMRSFGEDPLNVARKGLAYAMGLQNSGIIPSVKHFPGHGNTHVDSHYALPLIDSPLDEIEKTELYPFQYAINRGVSCVMVGHLYLPAIEKQPNLSSSLSKSIMTDLLKEKMGFEGLIVTDGLDMKGATAHLAKDSIALVSLMGGADMLLLVEEIPASIEKIKRAAKSDHHVSLRIEESCKKILRYKYRAGLNKYRPSYTENLLTDIKKDTYKQLIEKLYENAITLLKNDNEILPLNPELYKNIATLALGPNSETTFQKEINKMGVETKNFTLPKSFTKTQASEMEKTLEKHDLIIVSIQHTNILANKNYGITLEQIDFVKQLSQKNTLILNVFASPYALNLFQIDNHIKAVLISYQDKVEAARASASVIVGKIKAQGKLPVTINNHFKLGSGIETLSLVEQSSYDLPVPEVSFLNNRYTQKIDSIATLGIKKKAYPGCQIVAMKDGKIIYNKNYGYHTYDSLFPVRSTDVYDVASLTKILASTLAIMKLVDDERVDINDPVSKYFHFLKKTDKENIRWIDIFTHQSGLESWIPYYKKTLTDKNPNPEIYNNTCNEDYPYRVAENLYISNTYYLKIFDTIATSKLKSKEYRYSDLGYYFIPKLVEATTNQYFEDYLNENFYKPLGLNRTFFRPLSKLPKEEIVPTEFDQAFRMQQLHGDVHDQGAAMLGGVSGHAGLFSNATEVAAIMQFILDKGKIKDEEIISEATIKKFTSRPFASKKNRRGICFDKPPLDPNEKTRTPSCLASGDSFGHTGFTGTFAWADPENNLIVVFLSNRVYPDSKNNKLTAMSIRSNIHELFYQAVQDENDKS
ncbi:MAG: serine hydrolase [Lentimicrobiaceae bacterium]|jgi:beta-glucosidase-like glycosyl hydrolase/CubicO group peptidase (beta-lactamase class C family)|nr:serine hydrolase [Lentimicrobiaceae bacterium]